MIFDAQTLKVLLEEVKWGKPNASEIDAVAEALRDGQIPATAEYTALHIVARSVFPRHEGLVASFLDGDRGPMLARLSLQALCSWYDLGERYRADLLKFIEWVPWDESDDVRQVALSATGELLRELDEPGLFGALLKVAADEAEMRITRDTALMALARAMGDDWSALPAATASAVDLSWARSVVERAVHLDKRAQ